MESKTPKFDKLIEEILDDLTPHTRTCKWEGRHKHCMGKFGIEEEDINFLKTFKVPPPNYCPVCRKMRRMAHMNYVRLSKRKCDAPEHGEMIISILPEECPFPVYDYHYYTSDEFNPFSFGVEYKNGESPMETFLALRKKVPMPSFLNRDPSSINSEYSNGGQNMKNGYFVFTCHDVENAWYSNVILKGRNIMDSYWITDSESIYENIFSDHIYQSSFVYFSSGCTDCKFIFDCRNCSNCFGCVNLRNQKYCVFNKQFTKEEYEKFLESVYPLSKDMLAEYKKKFWGLVKSLPMNGTRNIAITNSSGNNLRNSKNLYDVTDADRSENIAHSDGIITLKDAMDVTFTGDGANLVYSGVNIGTLASNIKFSVSTKFSNDCEFTFNSKNSSNCFMCFGFQKANYCILNKQYSKDDYYKVLDEIKSEMLKRGEYSDGVGMEFSAQAYNFSIGQISFPLSDREIINLGGYVAKDPETNAGNQEFLFGSQVPATIEEVTDEILNKAIKCEKTGRPFRITPSELEFYRKMKLPLPTVHPSVRMEERIRHFTANGKSYKTTCAKCDKKILAMFDSSENFILYCEDCFKKEIY